MRGDVRIVRGTSGESRVESLTYMVEGELWIGKEVWIFKGQAKGNEI